MMKLIWFEHYSGDNLKVKLILSVVFLNEDSLSHDKEMILKMIKNIFSKFYPPQH